jgi:hypothetical protein
MSIKKNKIYLTNLFIIDWDDTLFPTTWVNKNNINFNNNYSENEYKLGLALSDIFENYESIFPASDNNKFNKNIILLSLREITNMSTKEIRSSMKRYKKIYLGLISPSED